MTYGADVSYKVNKSKLPENRNIKKGYKMKELLLSLDWNTVLTTVWTAVLLPVLTYMAAEIQNYAREKKIDHYTKILQMNVENAVKDVYETVVKSIKGTEKWTDEKKLEVKETAKKKAVFALSSSACECLKTAHADFDEYLDSLVEASLFDLKH